MMETTQMANETISEDHKSPDLVKSEDNHKQEDLAKLEEELGFPIKVKEEITDDPEKLIISVSLPKPEIQQDAEFQSFVDLKEALTRYQEKNKVQLVVKDSKLLAAESTKKVGCLDFKLLVG